MSRTSCGLNIGIAAGFAALIGLGAGAGVLHGDEVMVAGAGALIGVAITLSLMTFGRR